MKHISQHKKTRLAVAGLLALALGTTQAAITLTTNVTFNAGNSLYTYTYSVTNTGTVEDGVLVSIPVIGSAELLGLGAPNGFNIFFDSSQGWVNLIEDDSVVTPQSFAPGSTVGPFDFDSTTGPGSVTFLAYDAAGTEFSGPTRAPIPEPAGTLLCALAAAVPLLSRRR